MMKRTRDRKYDVITFGDTCVDLIVTGSDVVPRFGQVEKFVDDYLLEMGGSCCIFACQAARLGLRVGMIGRVGDDDFGRLVMQRLDECGVDVSQVSVDPDLKTGLGIALCKDGDRAILTYQGSLSAVRPDDVSDEFLGSARHLHHGSYFIHTKLISHVSGIFRRARELGLTTSLDTNWDPLEGWGATLADVWALTDVFLPNEQEACHIAQRNDARAAVEWFRERGVPIVALKRGDMGARAYDESGVYERSVEPAVGGDSVGAGDSFDAGFLAGWLRGLSVERCLAIACACGRSVAEASGGLAGQPMWKQVLEMTRADDEPP